MKSPVGLGFTGSGFMGLTHAEAASLVEETKLVAVAGGSRAPKLAGQYRVDVEPDVAALVRRSDIDAVVITTPHHVHVGEALAAIEAGKHVLVEKPLATTVADCDRIIDAAARRGVVLAVGYHQRFRVNNRRACELIRAGEIGRLLAFQVSMPLPMAVLQADTGFGPSWRWWNDPESVGHIINGGPHAIDLLRWFTGSEVAAVSAFCRTFRDPVPVERTTVALIELAAGAIGTLFSTCELPAPNFPGEEFRFRLMGERALIDLDAYGELRLNEGGEWRTVSAQPPVGHHASATILNPVRMQSYQEQMRAFVRAAAGEPSEAGAGADGRAGVAACLAMLEASKRGMVVRPDGRAARAE